MAKDTLYECTNQACTLGSRKDPGRFTGGLTQEHAVNISGDPEAEYGEGICPNCGEKGKEVKNA